jgi:amino-acid N-acetyltransferase
VTAAEFAGELKLRHAGGEDLPAVLQLLRECHLPTDDVSAIVGDFWIAHSGSDLVGIIALECFGQVGLLRSLAVMPRYRSRGAAQVLCDRIIQDSRDRAVADLYLLTTDADAYFDRHGFAVIDRDEAPAAIKSTQQFAELCPDSAIVMHRRVAE